MTYKLEKKSSPNYSSRAKYGAGMKPTGVTIHHWGVTGQKHDNVVNYLCRKGGNTSAHAVVSAGRVTQIVPYDKAAWHAGSSKGNGTTIGIECRPEMSAGDWQTLVEYCADLEEQFGSLDYYRHSDWKATACPGKYGPKLDDLVKAVNAEHARRKKAPAKKPSTSTSAPSTSTSSVKILQRSTKYDATVQRWQEWLNAMFPSYSDLDEDGYFGPATEKVTKEFQRRVGLDDDGIVGKDTTAEAKKLGWKG